MSVRVEFGWREARRCFRDRMQRYPVCWGSGSGPSRRAAQEQQRRINRSIVFNVVMQRKIDAHTARTHKNEDLVGILLPLATLLSSSSTTLEYIEKRGPELSPKLGSPCDDCDC